MAGIPFVNDIDMRGNEILDARVPRLNGLPTATVAMNGWIVYNTQDDRYYVAAAAAWFGIPKNVSSTLEGVTAAQLRDRTTHSGQQPASSISDFMAAVIVAKLNSFAAPDGTLNLNGQKITALANGTAASDAVNKAQLDAVDAKASAAASGIAIKVAARAVSTTNITLTGTQTVDGVALVAGDRVLVAGQTSNVNNGIYVVAAGAWTRATDADASGELGSGTMIGIQEGTVNADKLFGLTSDGVSPIVPGTSAQVWTPLFQSATGEIITAGNGLSKTGTTLAVVPKAGGKIVVDGTGVSVDQGASGVSVRAEGSVPAGSTSATITHNLGLRWVQVEFYETATGIRVIPNWTPTGVNGGTAEFKTAPTANQYTWSART